MPRATLTARSVKNLMPREGRDRDYFYDSGSTSPPGFCVRVSATSDPPSRVYMVAYRARGRKRWLRLGDVTGISLKAARDAARDALDEVAAGRDPQDKKAQERTGLKVGELVMKFVHHNRTKQGRARSEKTQYFYRRTALRIKDSDLGKLPVVSATRQDVRDFVEEGADKTPTMRNKILALLKATYRWAVAREMVEHNITEGIEPPGVETRARRRLNDAELIKVLEALDAGVIPPQPTLALRVMLTCATRRWETLSMRWENLELDVRQPIWTIPGEQRKNRRELIIPLPSTLTQMLRKQQEQTGHGSYVFQGRKPGAHLVGGEWRWVGAIGEATGVKFSLHALRRTAANKMARLHIRAEIVARCLGHTAVPGVPEVTEMYSGWSYIKERADALKLWEQEIERLRTRKGMTALDYLTRDLG